MAQRGRPNGLGDDTAKAPPWQGALGTPLARAALAALAVFVVFAGYALLSTPTYLAEARLVLEPKSSRPLPPDTPELLKKAALDAELLEQAASVLELGSGSEARAHLSRELELASAGPQIVSVKVRATNAVAAARLANLIAERAAALAKGVLGFESAAREAAAELDRRNAELAAFEAKHPRPSASAAASAPASGSKALDPSKLTRERDQLQAKLADLQGEPSTDNPYGDPAAEERQALQRRVAEIERLLRANPVPSPSASASPNREELEQERGRLAEAVARARAAASAPSEELAVSVLDAPVPASPIHPNRRLVVLFGTLAALVASIAASRSSPALRVRRAAERTPSEPPPPLEGASDAAATSPSEPPIRPAPIVNVRQSPAPDAAAAGSAADPAPPLPEQQPVALLPAPAAEPLADAPPPVEAKAEGSPDTREQPRGASPERAKGQAFAGFALVPVVPTRIPTPLPPPDLDEPTAEPEPAETLSSMGRIVAPRDASGEREARPRAASRKTQTLGTPREFPAVSAGAAPDDAVPAQVSPTPPAPRHLSTPPYYGLATLSTSAQATPASTQRKTLSTSQPLIKRFGVLPSWAPDASVELERRRKLSDELYPLAVESCFVIGVTGVPEARVGKSRVAAELALALAEAKSPRVLLLEGDFEWPLLHELMRLEMPISKGFSQQLRAQKGEQSDWVVMECGPTLHAIVEGMMRSPGLILSRYFEESLQLFRAYYDFVVIDGPLVSAEVDCRALDALIDGVVIVTPEEGSSWLTKAITSFQDKRSSSVVSVEA